MKNIYVAFSIINNLGILVNGAAIIPYRGTIETYDDIKVLIDAILKKDENRIAVPESLIILNMIPLPIGA